MEYDNINDWQMEYRALQECCTAVEGTELHATYEARSPTFRSYIDSVIAKFGDQRVNIILGYTVRSKPWDGRLSREVKAWAEQQPRFANPPAVNGCPVREFDNRDLIADIHPAILNSVVKAKMEHDMQHKKPSDILKPKDRGDAR